VPASSPSCANALAECAYRKVFDGGAKRQAGRRTTRARRRRVVSWSDRPHAGRLALLQRLTVEQFVALLVLASILALGIIFTIRARSGGGKALALLGTLILLVLVSVAIIFSGAPLLLRALPQPPR
jgi:hypothetical protein